MTTCNVWVRGGPCCKARRHPGPHAPTDRMIELMQTYYWYGLVANHTHADVDEMWNCPGCLAVIRKQYPIYKSGS